MDAEYKLYIGHNNIDLESIELENINKTKENLFIGYGHTSHGSQLMSGMRAINNFFGDNTYKYSSVVSKEMLTIKEGGELQKDCGYTGWDTHTRNFLTKYPECNVIIWSWCGQVNSVDVLNHYLIPMNKLEKEYPNVVFVYMTGHLEGLGIEGTIYTANQKIRDFCEDNKKVLFDFADIEKYDPDGEINYQEYKANDNCDYLMDNQKRNWANEWLQQNPEHLLSKISSECTSCAHSVSLNCVKKGIAAWYLWNGINDILYPTYISENTATPKINLLNNHISIENASRINELKIINILGEEVFTANNNSQNHFTISLDNIDTGAYIMILQTSEDIFTEKIIINK
jgi:hypothetical protein